MRPTNSPETDGRRSIYISTLSAVCSVQTRGCFDRRGRRKSAKGVGGEEPGTGAKQAAYAPGEGGTAGCKGGGKGFLPGWLIWFYCCAILSMNAVRQIGICGGMSF